MQMNEIFLFLLMDVNIHERSGQSNCTRSLTHSLTHSILINLFIKLEFNNFLLPPLLRIVFVQECSVVFRRVFDEGRLSLLAGGLILGVSSQPCSQGLFPGLGAGREKTLASAGHVSTLHPEILGVIN